MYMYIYIYIYIYIVDPLRPTPSVSYPPAGYRKKLRRVEVLVCVYIYIYIYTFVCVAVAIVSYNVYIYVPIRFVSDFIRHHHHPEGVVYRSFCLNSSTSAVSEIASGSWWCTESLFPLSVDWP